MVRKITTDRLQTYNPWISAWCLDHYATGSATLCFPSWYINRNHTYNTVCYVPCNFISTSLFSPVPFSLLTGHVLVQNMVWGRGPGASARWTQEQSDVWRGWISSVSIVLLPRWHCGLQQWVWNLHASQKQWMKPDLHLLLTRKIDVKKHFFSLCLPCFFLKKAIHSGVFVINEKENFMNRFYITDFQFLWKVLLTFMKS